MEMSHIWKLIPKFCKKYELPPRIWVRVIGYNDHTGDIKWYRNYYDVVATQYYTPWGIVEEDMNMLLRRADIPSINHINDMYWTDLIIPKFDYPGVNPN